MNGQKQWKDTRRSVIFIFVRTIPLNTHIYKNKSTSGHHKHKVHKSHTEVNYTNKYALSLLSILIVLLHTGHNS